MLPQDRQRRRVPTHSRDLATIHRALPRLRRSTRFNHKMRSSVAVRTFPVEGSLFTLSVSLII